MAKIIQFTGKYIGGINKYEEIYLNADQITFINKRKDEGQDVTCISLATSSGTIAGVSIYTKLSVEDVIKLIND